MSRTPRQIIGDDAFEQLVFEGYDVVHALSTPAPSIDAEAVEPLQQEGHEEHIYQRFQTLFDRGRKAGGFEGETQNLIRELTNALRDAANWRAETKIALRIEQDLRKKAEAAPAPATAARMEAEREERDEGVSIGIAMSVAYLIRDVDQPGYALEWWDAAGLTIEQCERLGLEDYDLDPIRAALSDGGRADG